MDALCFEGGLFTRSGVGDRFADPRFFTIYWDDTMYGYRAGKVTNPIVVPDVILRRTREIGNWDIAGVRGSLHFRHEPLPHHAQPWLHGTLFHVVRDYRPLVFGFGTLLTAAKEVIRLVIIGP